VGKKFDPRRASLLELCVAASGGQVRGARLAAFVLAWDAVRRDLGRPPSVDEYAAWWKVSRRAGYYEQQRFREAFPDLSTPDPLLDLMEEQGADSLVPVDFGGLVAG
jgi:hypothetical protein